MHAFSPQRLVRHSYSDGTYSYHYASVTGNRDEALMNIDVEDSTIDPADRLTFWPPQPMTPWF
jgi:major membrane immunogen (membrane-anchored lipoprotein)